MSRQAQVMSQSSRWEGRVEDGEHMGLPKGGILENSGQNCFVENGSSNSKIKKKKKNCNKATVLPAKTEIAWSKCSQISSHRAWIEETEFSPKGNRGGVMEKVPNQSQNFLEKLQKDNEDSMPDLSNSSKQSPSPNPPIDEGWEIAASRKSRRNEDSKFKKSNCSSISAGRTKAGGPSHGYSHTNFVPVFSKESEQGLPNVKGVNDFLLQVGGNSVTVGELSRRSEGPGSGVQKPKMTAKFPVEEKKEMWTEHGKGKMMSFAQSCGKADSHTSRKEFWSNKNSEAKDNVMCMDNISGIALGGSVNNVKETGSSFSQLTVESSQRVATLNGSDLFFGSEERNETESTIDSQILSTLLPFEQEARIGSAEPIQRETVMSSYQVDGTFMLDDYLSSPHSGSLCSGDNLDVGSDSELMDSEDYDSDGSDASLDTIKRNKCFRIFFETMGSLTNDQLNEHERQWHCPVCKGGVGAIDWYRGLQPLLAHAKTVRSKRVKLHLKFAKVLEDELNKRGAGSGSTGEGIFGRWKGLMGDNEMANPLIIWPPMVMIQNTKLELDDQDKWIGMGNRELLDLFKDYNVMKARHSYGPQGHRGMSVVIFNDSPTGYMDAQRLDKHFKDARRGRENWEHPGKVLLYPGGNRILYGYMVTEEDIQNFNKHSGKSKLKWNLRHLQEAVIDPMRKMDEENLQLNLLKKKVEKQKEHSKAMEKTVCLVARKLRLKDEEIQVIRKKALEQHEENQREMDCLEQTFKDRINKLASDWARREEELRTKDDKFNQEHIDHCQQLERTCTKILRKKKSDEEHQKQQQAKIEEEIARQSELVETSFKVSEDYESQKREVMRKQHIKRMEFMRRQYQEALNFEKEIEKEKIELLERYTKQRQNKGKQEDKVG
eukprot:c25425_g1_i1 orf=403-3063(-)